MKEINFSTSAGTECLTLRESNSETVDQTSTATHPVEFLH